MGDESLLLDGLTDYLLNTQMIVVDISIVNIPRDDRTTVDQRSNYH